MTEVKVLLTGYCSDEVDGKFAADCTVTLITCQQNGPILVDTSGPWNKSRLTEEINKAGYQLEDIKIVVCTHGHSDHVGNLNLFPTAKIIVGFDVSCGNRYENFDFKAPQARYPLSGDVYVIPTPGHMHHDVSVIVKTKDHGIIAVTGDLFESEQDLKDSSIWKDISEDPVSQEANRTMVLSFADYIIPGHGPMFCVQK